MEVINKLVSNTKRLAMEESDLKEELMEMKIKLLAEENNLASIEEEREGLAQQNALLQQSLDFFDTNSQLIKSFQNVAKTSIIMHSHLKVFIENTHPTTGEQSEILTKLKSNYNKMLEKYESTPTYKAILEEEAKERELTSIIAQKRQELENFEE